MKTSRTKLSLSKRQERRRIPEHGPGCAQSLDKVAGAVVADNNRALSGGETTGRREAGVNRSGNMQPDPAGTIMAGDGDRETSYAYLECLLNYANVPIIAWNSDLEITLFNRAFERLTGRTSEEVLHRPLNLLLPGDRREAAMSRIHCAAAGERWESVEVDILCKNGSVRTVLWNSAPVFTSDGKTIISTIAQGQDITERVLAEKALRASEEHMNSILDGVPDRILLLDKDLKILWANKTALDVNPDAIGQTCHKAYAGGEEPCKDCPCRKAVFSERVETRVMCVSVAVGIKGISYWENIGVPMRNSQHKVVGVIEIARNVTERVLAEKALRESEKRLRTIFEQAVDSIVLIAVDTGAFIEFNDSTYKNLGYSRAEFVRLRINDVDVMESPDDLASHKERLVQNGGGTFTTKHRRKDGGVRDVRVSTRVISLGGTRYFLSTWRDITERKRSEEAIREANERLIAEQEALKEKNIALREILNQIDNEKKQIGRHVQSNIDRIVMPILSKLETRVGPDQKDYITLLHSSLREVSFPFVNKLEVKYTSLTPREVEVCNMVRNGLTSKEIASALDTSELTVRKQRKNIRRKLGISHDKINLSSFLQAM